MSVPRIILATGNGAAIARQNPDAVVVDYGASRLRRGEISVSVTSSGKVGFPFRVAALLCSLAGRVTPHEALIEALWGDDASGGPLAPMNVFHQYAYRARWALAAVGLRTVNRYGRIEVSAIQPPLEAAA